MTLSLFQANHQASFFTQCLRVFVAILLLGFGYQLWLICNIAWLMVFNPASTALMQNRLAEQQAFQLTINPNSAFLQKVMQPIALLNSSQKDGQTKKRHKHRHNHADKKPQFTNIQHAWVNYDEITPHIKRAVIASEDATFMQHSGFDWQGIQKAYKKNLKKGKIVAGGSTISQQLAKNLFLSSQRSTLRKAQEVVITVMLETMLSKERILALYLNMIEWGNGVFGVEAAARHYYHSSAKQLNRHQAATLAAMIPNPRFYDTHQSTRFLNRHASTIRARMHMVVAP
jgi:monofunctional biosynthetic peptidoglycan transglycosylase